MIHVFDGYVYYYTCLVSFCITTNPPCEIDLSEGILGGLDF
jgi:hypothetical protein